MPTLTPTYSHGGTTAGGFTAVPGTSQSSGRPVAITVAASKPAMNCFWTGTSVTFVIEGNGGTLDSTGNPPSAEWFDYSNGGYSLTNGQSISKKLPREIPYWRTRITAINAPTGAGLVSYVPCVVTNGGVLTSAGYPDRVTPDHY